MGRSPAELRWLRSTAVMVTAAGMVAIVLACMSTIFDYRYLLGALPFLPVGGAVGLWLLINRMT